MTDTAPAEDPTSGALEFVHQGIIRIHFPTEKGDGTTRQVRVRRPFLGELKELRVKLDEIRDDLAVMSGPIAAEGARLQAEAEALAKQVEAGELDPEAHQSALADIRRRDRDAGKRMEDAREERTLEWWELVFARLALDPVPDRMLYPAWILDARLTNMVLNHWRQVPSGPG